MKKVYFISDAHLGSWAISDRKAQERRLVCFLDEVKQSAMAVYMLGDMFDYWYEYKYVVPKGYTRLLGKISELTDSGVEVHYFTGNHDIWMYGYLESECGVIIHKEPQTISILGKSFYLAHGDGLGDPSPMFRFMRRLFRNRTCQFLFSLLPTRWSMWLGLRWAQKSMEDHRLDGVPQYLGEDNEYQITYAKNYLKTQPNIDYFIFGHRHIELDLMLAKSCRILILGDWISQFTYAVFDGKNMTMSNYLEGGDNL